MESINRNSFKWAYLPVLFCSAAVLSTQLVAGEYQAQDARQVSNIGHQYVGGKTRVGVSVSDDGDASADLSHVFSETQNSSTSGGLWAGFDLDGDDKGVDSGGVQINHNWVSRDGQGNATHVNKAFAAYDRNETDDAKVTVGYGQERASGFWEGHVSKGISDKRLLTQKSGHTTPVYEKGYDWGVGASVGTHLASSNARVRAGIDHQWGDEVADSEEQAMMTTLSAGVEKFFHGTPHSIGLDVAASRKKGGHEYSDSDDTTTTANLSYHYDFGGANIYQPDQRYRRVRVEVPGKGRAATYAKKPVYRKEPIYKQQPVYKNQPIYKKQPIYVNKSVQVPTGNMAKSTVELEGQTFFKYGSAVLIPSAQQRLRQIANEIRKHGYKGNIRITGNSCGLGDPRRDQELSEQRANAVRNYLVTQGFNPAHLMARGLGKSHPKYPTTADQDFKNRRVDIEYVTERQVRGGAGAGGYRTENRRVQNGFRNVISGYKRIQVGTKNVQVGVRNVQTGTTDILVSQGAPGTPRVIWRTEAIPTSPAWVTRALRSNFSHNRSVDTYRTTAGNDSSDRGGNNNGPMAVNDSTKIYENQTAEIDVLANDTDADDDALTIVGITQGDQGGSVSIQDNKIIYTAASGFTGKDTFTYTIRDIHGATSTASVSVTVSPADTGGSNNAPSAVNDMSSTDMNTAVTINVLGNDTDADGDALQLIEVTQGAQGGSVSISNNEAVYAPAAGFTGKDTFTYTISDGNGGTSTASVSVNVSAADTGTTNSAPNAVNDYDISTEMNTAVTIDVTANDTDPDGDMIMIKSYTQGVNGQVTEGAGGQLIYTPNAGFADSDSFTYIIEDVAGLTSEATVYVNVKAATTPPSTGGNGCTVVCTKAKADDVLMDAGTTATVAVLDNDEGVDLKIIEVSQGAKGTVSFSGNTVTYTPVAGASGDDLFWYAIQDATGYKDSNMVRVYIEDAKK